MVFVAYSTVISTTDWLVSLVADNLLTKSTVVGCWLLAFAVAATTTRRRRRKSKKGRERGSMCVGGMDGSDEVTHRNYYYLLVKSSTDGVLQVVCVCV